MNKSATQGDRAASLRPAGHVNHYATWEVATPAHRTHYVRCLVGVESSGADASALLERVINTFAGAVGPASLGRGIATGPGGERSDIFYAYWNSPAHYAAWLTTPQVASLWAADALLEGPLGLWRESMVIPVERNETNYSNDAAYDGMAQIDKQMRKTDVHGYWGSARERIPASARDTMPSAAPDFMRRPPAATETRGRRVRITLPGNTCVIRSFQDWSQAQAAEVDWYLGNVEPVLRIGLDYLNDNRTEARCYGMRYIREYDMSGAVDLNRTSTFGYFESLQTLERWTHTHPTHLNIFQAAISMVQRFQGEVAVKLGHEVSVLPEGMLSAEYINCARSTGFLPWSHGD
ncbi:phenylacetaldoxime dehydratase family protein [Variovorax sp. NFACC27]|uniref:phenylacetaldoxime dehydratase family protein n=1 Tax=unclassified Variovorax TaxID=663243 RepID=UPI000B8843F7